MDTDPRTWEKSISLTQTIDISSLPNGIYTTYLHLPDADADLALGPEYSVQLANTSMWEAETGYNKLSQSVTVDNTTVTDSFDAEENNWAMIYPNPASQQVTIKTVTTIAEQVELINSTGQVLKVIYPDALLSTLNISDVKPRFYMINVICGGTNRYLSLLIK